MKKSTTNGRSKHVTLYYSQQSGMEGSAYLKGFLRGHLLHPFLDFPSDLIAHTIPYSTDGVHFAMYAEQCTNVAPIGASLLGPKEAWSCCSRRDDGPIIELLSTPTCINEVGEGELEHWD